MLEQQVNQLVGHLFRHEAGKMAAVLTRMLGFGNLDTAQDIVQDTLLKAVTLWKYKGIPDNPSAWLYTVAKRKAIDTLRHQKFRDQVNAEIAHAMQSEWLLTPAVHHRFMENEIEDSQLRMIFACCHPSIPYESQIALTLKTLCGLSIAEIASSFLTTEETISKRLYRAREKIRSEKIDLDAPLSHTIPERLTVVLHALYLLFNEGYHSTHSEQVIRNELCEEAMRLCFLLRSNVKSNTPETNALLALMCLQASRLDARLSQRGDVILLKYQDRQRWNKKLIDKGLEFLSLSSDGESISEYHLEAAIAAVHASAESFEKTNWKEIHTLYEALLRIKPGPVVAMNKAIALGYATGAQQGLEALLQITGLDENPWYHAALGDFFAEIKDNQNSIKAYDQAIALTHSNVEKELLLVKRKNLA